MLESISRLNVLFRTSSEMLQYNVSITETTREKSGLIALDKQVVLNNTTIVCGRALEKILE